jgi:hypothetical protein
VMGSLRNCRGRPPLFRYTNGGAVLEAIGHALGGVALLGGFPADRPLVFASSDNINSPN